MEFQTYDQLTLAKYILYYRSKNKKHIYQDITNLDLQNILNDVDTEYCNIHGYYLTDRVADNYDVRGYVYWYSAVYYKYSGFGAMDIWKVNKSLNDLKEYKAIPANIRKFIQCRTNRYLYIRYLVYGY